MTGSLTTRTTSSGKVLYYVKISYKDPLSLEWKTKTVSTGLEAKPGNKKAAKAKIKEAIEEYAYLENPDCFASNHTPDTPLSDFLTDWIELKRTELRKSTYDGYYYRVKILKSTLCKRDYRLREITPSILDKYFHYMLRYGKRDQKTGERGPMTVRSVRSYKSILYAVFNQAVLFGLIPSNPVQGVKVSGGKNKAFSEEFIFLSEEEIANLIHFLAENFPQLVEIAIFAAYYGLRRSEILGLKWDAIDYDHHCIHIRHTIVRVRDVEANDLTKTTAGRRSLNLFPVAERCLENLKSKQEKNKKFFGNTYQNTEGYIFTWEDGKSFDPNYITAQFRRAFNEYGMPAMSLHKLRHSCASMLIEKGWDLKKVQYWLGQDDAMTTLNIYSHYNRKKLNENENDLTEISAAISDLFDPE